MGPFQVEIRLTRMGYYSGLAGGKSYSFVIAAMLSLRVLRFVVRNSVETFISKLYCVSVRDSF